MAENSGMFQRFVKNYVKYLRAKTKKQVGNDYWEKYIAEHPAEEGANRSALKQAVLREYRDSEQYMTDLDMALWNNEELQGILAEDPEEMAKLKTIFDSEIGLIRGNLKRNQGINVGKVLRSYEKKQEAENYEPDRTVPELAAEYLPDFVDFLTQKLEKYFTTQRVRVFTRSMDGNPVSVSWLNADNVGDYLRVYGDIGLLEPILYKYVLQGMPPAYSFALEVSHRYKLPKTGAFVSKSAADITAAGLMGTVYRELYDRFTTEHVVALLKRNGRHSVFFKGFKSALKKSFLFVNSLFNI